MPWGLSARRGRSARVSSDCSAVSQPSSRCSGPLSTPKRFHSTSTDRSVGSCSSSSRMPPPIACSVPAGTRMPSPALTGISWRACEHHVGVLLVDPGAGGLQVQRLLEADVDGGAGLGLDDQPRLGLAVAEAEVLLGERAARVVVDGQALAGVEELDQQGGVGAVVRRRARGRGTPRGRPAIASLRIVPSSSRLRPSVSEPHDVAVEPTQSSGRPSSPSGTPRSASMRAPPL